MLRSDPFGFEAGVEIGLIMVAVPSILKWTNQKASLYHGTLDIYVHLILGGIKVNKGRKYTDFGRGFYTTTVQRQAESWAWQLSQLRVGTLPAVICFDVDRDELAKLDCLCFVRGSFDADDFWSFILHCRSGGTDHGRAILDWYDVVIGPVAAIWTQRLAIYDADQISFHTDKAADLLNKSNPRRVK
jgi:hypothetical protein